MLEIAAHFFGNFRDTGLREYQTAEKNIKNLGATCLTLLVSRTPSSKVVNNVAKYGDP